MPHWAQGRLVGTTDFIMDEPGEDERLSGVPMFSYSPRIPDDPQTAKLYYEARLFMLAAVEQARLDVVGGVTDSSVEEGKKAGVRADALAFFCDGRYDGVMSFCGVESNYMAAGIEKWMEAMGAWCRNMPGCPPAASDCAAIIWGPRSGLLNEQKAWDEAEKRHKSVRIQVKRHRVKLL